MGKLKEAIRYECSTSFKYIWYFYAIQYAIVALIYAILSISTGSTERLGVSCLETNTFIYVGIVSILGMTEDFKMLIQNGFMRKYIFISTVSLFVFMSGIMALFDTAAGNILRHIVYGYTTLFGSIYGYDNIFISWLWLFLLYMFICVLLYLAILVIYKIGKTLSICLGVALGGIVLLITAVFQYVLSNEAVNKIIETAAKAMGFMPDGTIIYLFPVLTLLLFVVVLGIGSYAVIRRIELKS